MIATGSPVVPTKAIAGLASVIVVTANSGPLTRKCIDRVLASTDPFEIIIVDNASTDGIIESLQRAHADDPRVRIERNSVNLGFGAACNRGARLASGDALLFLNPDCLPDSDTLFRLRSVATDHPRAGLLGVTVEDAQGQVDRASCRREPTLWRAICSMTGLSRFEARFSSLAGVDMQVGAHEQDACRVDAVSGACMFVDRRVFAAISGFDEGYFLHCEDLDLCRRVRDAGHEVLFVASIRLRHEQGSSSHRRSIFVARHKHRGMWRYFRKFDPAARNPLLRGIVWCGIWGHFMLMLPVYALRQQRSRGRRAVVVNRER